MKYYTGIGSRKTPDDILSLISQLAYKLASEGWILRSGAAEGADTAFENGCIICRDKNDNGQFPACNIYIPWIGYNNRSYGHPYYLGINPESLSMAEQYHPAWNKCSSVAKKLHARNCHQVLGDSLTTPSSFVLCWHPGYGGTLQAVRIAEAHGIPVYNMKDPKVVERLQQFLIKKEV